jgi:hypothetical protein
MLKQFRSSIGHCDTSWVHVMGSNWYSFVLSVLCFSIHTWDAWKGGEGHNCTLLLCLYKVLKWAVRPKTFQWCFFSPFFEWGENESTWYVGHYLAYCTSHGWWWEWSNQWNDWQEKPKYSEKTCPNATLSTTNLTWPDLGSNSGRRSGKLTFQHFMIDFEASKTL